MRDIFTITTGSMGVGKSYTIVAELCRSKLRNPRYKLHTNIDLNIDKIVEYCAKRGIQVDPSRFVRIPETVIDSWRNGKSGPWQWYADQDLQGVHIALDESHEMCSKSHDRSHVAKWLQWIRTIRHAGATVEFITQTDSDFPEPLKKICRKRFHVDTAEVERDPIWGIQLSDFSQVWAKLTGHYAPRIGKIEILLRDGKGHKNDVIWYDRSTEIFDLYNSHQATKDGHQGNREPMEWEYLSWPRFVWWFFWKNGFRLIFNMKSLIILGILFGLSGGGGLAVGLIDSTIKQTLMQSLKMGQPIQPGAEETEGGSGLEAETEAEAVEDEKAKRIISDLRTRIEQLDQMQRMVNERIVTITVDRDALAAYVNRGSDISILTDSYVVMQNGDVVYIGDEIQEGTLKGHTIAYIDNRQRKISLSNGDVIRYTDAVRRRLLASEANDPARVVPRFEATDIPRPLPGNPGNGIPADGTQGVPPSDNSFRRGGPPRGFPTIPHR